MKFFLVLLISICCLSCNDTTTQLENVTYPWNEQKREQFLANRNKPSSWDNEMLQNDKALIGIGKFGPFEIGVFPVPKYNLIGEESFKGLGNKSGEFKIKDKSILMNSFFVGANELNKIRLNGLKNEVFCQLLVLTDTIDDVNYNLNKSIAISRNHPDYLGQGFVKTKTHHIDYVAFQTAENNAYAIVNTRIFDLTFGKTILIAPQKDGTLKSLQLKSPELTSESISNYTEKLITEEQIITFFEDNENI